MVAVDVESIGSANGNIVQQAEAVAALGLILTADYASGSCMVPWWPDRAEGVPGLHCTCSAVTGCNWGALLMHRLCTVDSTVW